VSGECPEDHSPTDRRVSKGPPPGIRGTRSIFIFLVISFPTFSHRRCRLSAISLICSYRPGYLSPRSTLAGQQAGFWHVPLFVVPPSLPDSHRFTTAREQLLRNLDANRKDFFFRKTGTSSSRGGLGPFSLQFFRPVFFDCDRSFQGLRRTPTWDGPFELAATRERLSFVFPVFVFLTPSSLVASSFLTSATFTGRPLLLC